MSCRSRAVAAPAVKARWAEGRCPLCREPGERAVVEEILRRPVPAPGTRPPRWDGR